VKKTIEAPSNLSNNQGKLNPIQVKSTPLNNNVNIKKPIEKNTGGGDKGWADFSTPQNSNTNNFSFFDDKKPSNGEKKPI